MRRIKYYRLPILAVALLLLFTIKAKATDDPPIVKVFSGATGELNYDPLGGIATSKEVIDDIFYNLNSTILNPANDQITNAITLTIDEDRLFLLSASDNIFTASVRFKVEYTLKNGSTGTLNDHTLQITYKKGEGIIYNPRQTLKFDNCRKVKIIILSDAVISGGNFEQILRLENRMIIKRDYVFLPTHSSSDMMPSHTTPDEGADELQVNWSSDANIAKGKTHIDVEWTWIDKEAEPSYKVGGVYDANLIFHNNSSRITIESRSANSYKVPLIYDGAGYLFYRIRPVQYLESGQVINGEWSTKNSFTFLERLSGEGHEESLNWQTTTSFAEEGKRKTVVQYFDGTLRGRQTVTKDNVTNKTVVAETFYDYQGRPAINILPAPTMNSVIKFTAEFNKFEGNYITPKDAFDIIPGGSNACNFLTPKLDKDHTTGAAVYYSPNNTEKDLGINKFIPDANGYAYTETRYTPDATGRIAVQGGVGETHQLGKSSTEAHDTKYFYGKPDQKELDALFGNEVGDASHYFKNMVRDANGQYSVSYVDMHGRTVATALAGNVPENLKELASYAGGVRTITKNLLTPSNNRVEGRSVVLTTTLLVTSAGEHTFNYNLTPRSAEILACTPPGEEVCYDCYYNLEIIITRECESPTVRYANNISFIGGVPQTDMSCSTSAAGISLEFVKWMEEGEYNITKTLTVNKPAQDWYRENLFRDKNICKDLQSFYDEIYTTLLATSNCEITCEQCTTALGTYSQYRAAFLTQQGINPATVVPYEAEIAKSYKDAKAQCDAICLPDKKNVLGSIRQAMLQDMTPDDGQYARIDLDLNGVNGVENVFNTSLNRWERYSDRIYNIFKIEERNFQKPKGENGELYYMDELGQPDPSAVGLSQDAFIRDFKPSWANSLITYHPEYCKLKKAETSLKESYENDYLLEQIDTWTGAAAYTSGEGLGVVNTDPFFSGVGEGYKETMIRYIKTNFDRFTVNQASPANTLWKAAWISIFCHYSTTIDCAENAPLNPSQFQEFDPDCPADWNHVWRIFRTLYLSEKDRMVNQWLDAQCGTGISTTLVNNRYELRFGKPENYYSSATYISDIINTANNNSNPYAAQTPVNSQMSAQYNETCESYKTVWINRLMQCDVIAQKPAITRAAILAAITTGLKEICVEGSDIDHPMGSSTVKPGSLHTPTSFQAVITDVFSTYSIPVSELCHPDMIDFPQPYDKQIPVGDEIVWQTRDDCVCERLTALQNLKTSMGYDNSVTLSAYIQSRHGITISQDLIDQLVAGCSGTCEFYDPPVKIPAFLSCTTPLNNCITCNQYDSLKNIFVTTFPPLSNAVLYAQPANDDELNANKAFAMFMNNRTGFNKTWYEYLAFEQACTPVQTFGDSSGQGGEAQLPAKLCTTETMFPQVEVPDECNADLPTIALNMAMEQYDVYVTQQNDLFDDTYLKKCLEARDHETFTVSAPVAEYHYTLYYYDQAGNLVKTVPPAGVIANYSPTYLALVQQTREDPLMAPIRIEHNLQTQYRYNSLNQVIAQKSPDGGTSHFWYDALGRLAVSQNEKQAADNKYSYTIYDPLGRIEEVGEKQKAGGSIAMSQVISQDKDDLNDWLAASGAEPNRQITKTIYDHAYTPLCTDSYLCQQNLRNRVSYSYLLELDNGDAPVTVPWSSASFYSYDIHGNVDVLLQDYNKGMGQLAGGNRYKKMVYKYDLVSGKVNEVGYQPGYADAFYHRYNYDAENKLTEVYTSKDYVHWSTDARYFYYRHGPLGRAVLGDLQVQGVDYAYTLQGWLKGVNSTGMKSGTITGDGTDCDGTGSFDNLLVNARLNPYTQTYKAKTSIEFLPGFESNLPDNFETLLDPGLETCGTTGTTGSSNESGDDPIFDMGQDGTPGSTSYPAVYGNKIKTRDAYGFSLNYFNNDYNRINSAVPNAFATIDMAIPTGDMGNGQTAQPLYNGNIGAMAVSIPKLSGTRLYGYNYDQLNRITNMHAFKGFNSSTNTFTPDPLIDYRERIKYDANGNILEYDRNGIDAVVPGGPGGLDMDDLAYEYYPNANKLKRVTDNPANTGNYPGDIDNQTDANNYVYDAIGNLVQDKAEGITNIEWTVYGKIAAIYKTKGGISSVISYTYDVAGNRISKKVVKDAINGDAYVMTYYVRDASGNVMSVYEDNNSDGSDGKLTQTEIHVYGSSRLGVYNVNANVETENREFVTITGATDGSGEVFSFTRGKKFFELSNHLGNVLVTVSDKRLPVVDELSSVCEGDICYNPLLYYSAEVMSANDYYPFGMNMPGRSYGTQGRYGFNGKERDKEVVQYDYGFRIYDPRLVRFKSVDPLSPSYPMLTPYQFASNRPTQAIDLDGLEAKDAQTGETLNQFGKTQLSKISEKDYTPWKDLLTLVTPKDVFTRANNRFYTHKFSDQKMTDASGDQLNLDYYSLNIVKLPPSFKTAGELFEHVRQNFSDFKKGGGNDFEGFDEGENAKWKSNDPLSSIMRFKGYVGGVNLDDADVITSHYSYSSDNAYWIFKPVEDYNYISNWTGFSDKGHPLAGYRQFGIIPNGEGGFTFYTRAVDMPYSIGDAIMSSAIFGGADKLWNAVIKNVTDYINKNGGSATANPVLSKRIQWSTDVSGTDKTKIEDCGN